MLLSLQNLPSRDRRDETRVANENLRAALGQAGLSPDDLARIVEVDARTVRRWLSGGTPYPRQRAKAARALDSTEHDLWPDIATADPPPRVSAAPASDILAGYPDAHDHDVPDRDELMHFATDRIELLGDTLIPILATPGVHELLAGKAAQGCAIRILLFDPHEHVPPLINKPGIEIRFLEEPAYYTIYRFDDQLLLTLHMVAEDSAHTPLIHVRRATSEGIFDRVAEYFDGLWERGSQPITPHTDPTPEEDAREGENPEPDPPLAAGEEPAAGRSERSAPPPRRWPRRPDHQPDRG